MSKCLENTGTGRTDRRTELVKQYRALHRILTSDKTLRTSYSQILYIERSRSLDTVFDY